jgi:hypothetical protein
MTEQNEKTETLNDGGIVDAKNFQVATRQSTDPLEKEEREKTKKFAQPAPKGKFVVTTNIKIDGKKFTRGDDFDGKLYADLLATKSVVSKEDWAKR